MRLRALFRRRHAAFLLTASASALLFSYAPARAQSQDAPKFEVGAEFSSLSLRSPDFAGTQNTVPGAGARFAYNVSDSVALEAAAYVHRRVQFSDSGTGGNPAQMQFG